MPQERTAPASVRPRWKPLPTASAVIPVSGVLSGRLALPVMHAVALSPWNVNPPHECTVPGVVDVGWIVPAGSGVGVGVGAGVDDPSGAGDLACARMYLRLN